MLYENVFIISGQLSKKSADDYYDDLLKKIKDTGGKILKTEFWGLRDLSYKIKKNSKGYYYMINCECDSKIFKEFDTKVRQDINFLRFFNLKIKSVNKDQSLLTEQKNN